MLHALRALQYRNFRLFFAGQGISIIGTWVQTIAMSWLMYRLTGSPVLLGLTTFLTQAPILFVGPISGWLSDRFERRGLLLLSQGLLMGQATLLGVLALLDLATPALILVLALVQGLCAALDTPVRQSFLSVMVPKREDLTSTIALNSFLMNSGRMIGPSVAGLLLAVVSEGVCFLVNALSYAAVIFAVRAMEGVSSTERRPGVSLGSGLKEGIQYARRFPPVRTLLPAVMLISFFLSPYSTLMPVVAKEIFGGGPRTLGFLVGAAGLGGLAGTAFLATRRSTQRLPRITATACGLGGLCMIAFSISRFYPLSLMCMFGVGFGVITTAASTNMVLQTSVAEAMRGRVISLYTMSFLGLAPFGALWAGFLAKQVGPMITLLIGGAACIVGAAALTAALPAYERKMA